MLLKRDMAEPSGYAIKVGDFGLSVLLPQHRTHLSNVRMGTMFYMCPAVVLKVRVRGRGVAIHGTVRGRGSCGAKLAKVWHDAALQVPVSTLVWRLRNISFDRCTSLPFHSWFQAQVGPASDGEL